MIKVIIMLLLLGVNPTFSKYENQKLLNEAMTQVVDSCTVEIEEISKYNVVPGTVRNVDYWTRDEKKYIEFTVNVLDTESEDRDIFEAVISYNPETKEMASGLVKLDD